jgi:hypothetical protein
MTFTFQDRPGHCGLASLRKNADPDRGVLRLLSKYQEGLSPSAAAVERPPACVCRPILDDVHGIILGVHCRFAFSTGAGAARREIAVGNRSILAAMLQPTFPWQFSALPYVCTSSFRPAL